MRVLPIIFKTEMVRAILDGRKTVTRRVVKPQPKMILSFNLAGYGHEKWSYPPPKAYELWGEKYKWPDSITKEDKSMLWTPPFHTDDILYVRETYCPDYFDPGLAGYRGDGLRGNRNAYRADYHKEVVGDVVPEPKWTPSIHMPKAAARIWLKVTDVRVEQLQDMYVDDAIKEGAWGNGNPNIPFSILWEKYPDTCNAIASFAHIWDSTTKKSKLDLYGWDANPWVWVIEFERCEKPDKI